MAAASFISMCTGAFVQLQVCGYSAGSLSGGGGWFQDRLEPQLITIEGETGIGLPQGLAIDA
jgi:hypothetical protein